MYLATVSLSVGRPTLTALPDGRHIGTTYDAAGNATQITLPSTTSHAFAFTPVELLSTYTPPSVSSSSPATQYSYDVDRDLTGMTQPGSVAVTYGYDTYDRLTSMTYPQGTLYRGYDGTGMLEYTTTPSGETTFFSYDGTLPTGITWSGPVTGALTFGFDTNFRMTAQSINGVSLPFGYDADGLLTGAGDLTLSLDSQNGRLTGTTLGSMTDAYTYDANGRLATYTAQYGGTTLYSESVSRDAIGRITQKTETVQGTTHVWGYTFDVAGRLTDVTEDSTFFSHYGYDADDNRTTYTNASGTVSPRYDAQDRLLTYGSASYTYTDNGELTGKTDGSGSTSYTYDALGNLLDVTPPSATPIDYVVDGQNRRVGKEVSGTLTTGFLYQDALNVVAQLDGSGNLVARYVFGSKPNVPDYFTNASGTFRILSDHLGSPRLVVDTSSGTVVEEIDYDEFGVVTNDTSPGLTPFGFAGGLYDSDTGLVRFGARDYDASVGRWTSKDPIRFVGGMNLYGYVLNDPINWTDSLGRDRDPACIANCFGAFERNVSYCHIPAAIIGGGYALYCVWFAPVPQAFAACLGGALTAAAGGAAACAGSAAAYAASCAYNCGPASGGGASGGGSGGSGLACQGPSAGSGG
jgi:RHS repeat-associated protein